MKNFFCLLFILPLLDACGTQESVNVVRKPRPVPAVSWDEIKPLVEASCNKCHGKTIGSAFNKDSFGAKAQARIENGSMPPGGGLDSAIKSKLLSY